jgi:hypothetical protein
MNDQPPIPPEIEFLSTCIVEISRREYGSALDTMKTGLIELTQLPAPISTQKLASALYVLFGALESNLKATFGDTFDQEVKVSKPSEVTVEVRCSFCGKERDEVEKIIGGPGVFICSECVRICNEVLSSDTVV